MKRRRREPKESRLYENIVVFQEDLEEILALIEEHLGQVEILDARLEFEDLDELRKMHGTKIKSLELRSKSSDIYFMQLSFDGRDLFAKWHLSPATRHLEADIREVLRRCSNRLRWLLLPAIVWLLVIVVLIIALPIAFLLDGWFSVLTIFVVVLLAGLGTTLFAKVNPAVRLVRRHEHMGFFRRNWERVLVPVCSVALWELGKWFFSRLTE